MNMFQKFLMSNWFVTILINIGEMSSRYSHKYEPKEYFIMFTFYLKFIIVKAYIIGSHKKCEI